MLPLVKKHKRLRYAGIARERGSWMKQIVQVRKADRLEVSKPCKATFSPNLRGVDSLTRRAQKSDLTLPETNPKVSGVLATTQRRREATSPQSRDSNDTNKTTFAGAQSTTGYFFHRGLKEL